MRKIKLVKIELDPEKSDAKPITKVFTVKELTCAQIIELTQTSTLFGDGDDSKNSDNGEERAVEALQAPKGLLGELADYGKEVESIMKATCDFTIKDLKPLAPSEINQIYAAFKEVNADFLLVLEKLKITNLYQQVLDRATSAFSKMFATS